MPSASTKNQGAQMNNQLPLQTEVVDGLKQAITALEKRLRNLEKRKTKLDLYRTKEKEGENLDKDQKQAMLKYEEVCSAVDFAREFQKQLNLINQECDRVSKRQQKKEKQDRLAQDSKRIHEVLTLQDTLNALGNDDVRADFQSGNHGAVVLTEQNLDHLDQLYKLISPSREDAGDYNAKTLTAAEHINNLVDARPWPVLNTTYKNLNELLKLITNCGYFENMDRLQKSPAEDMPVDTERSSCAIDPAAAVGGVPLLTDTIANTEISTVPIQTTPSPQSAPEASLVSSPPAFPAELYQTAPTTMKPQNFQEPKRAFQDILSSVKGNFDFLQESTIEEIVEAPAVDPAIVAIHLAPTHPRQATPILPTNDSGLLVSQPHADTYPLQQNIAADPRLRPQQEYTMYPGFNQQPASSSKATGYPSDLVYRNDNPTTVSHGLKDTSGPPPIPLPNQIHQPARIGEKFTMNANAPVFTSLYQDRDVAASSQPDDNETEDPGLSNRENRSFNVNSSRGNRGGRGNVTSGYSRGGSTANAASAASAGNPSKKRVYRGYPPDPDYKPDAYLGYNDSGFDVTGSKKSHAFKLNGGRGGNTFRGAVASRGPTRGGANRPAQQ